MELRGLTELGSLGRKTRVLFPAPLALRVLYWPLELRWQKPELSSTCRPLF
jgi:hypothetical protein